jgi:hypothetical protein
MLLEGGQDAERLHMSVTLIPEFVVVFALVFHRRIKGR